MSTRLTALKRQLPLAVAFGVGALLSAGVAVAQQPNMENALSQLQAARDSLLAARPNKGGHRDRALALVSQAIVQVQAGIAFAAANY
jgi:hypothetical protein